MHKETDLVTPLKDIPEYKEPFFESIKNAKIGKSKKGGDKEEFSELDLKTATFSDTSKKQTSANYLTVSGLY